MTFGNQKILLGLPPEGINTENIFGRTSHIGADKADPLLLIVPGIYKAYCWRLVPFIIADEPDISGKEARARSASMMNGSKWASFVLDLSFIGWKLVGALTFGIVNIVFTNPYEAATDTELYLTLKG